MTTLRELRALVAKGESSTLELKRSTGELREAMQTICAFANAKGGQVVIGAKPNGEIIGQQVSEQTLHDISAARDKFEPPIEIEVERVKVNATLSVLVLTVAGLTDSVPFTYDGRPFERVNNTTRKMPRERFEALLLERMHSRRRWENQIADEMTIKDIDRDEVFRILRNIEGAGRISGPSARTLPEALDRLGLRENGKILRAAIVLFGKKFMPNYPQCEIRMARFRGTDKAEFMDQRSVRGPAFKLLEEAQLFCERHFPLPAKIVPTQLRRVETPLIPPDALREILVNAIIHRDYSNPGGAMFLAIYDDRVEIGSIGAFPRGITADLLRRRHKSVLRNPIIADTFHRTGLIERWGRGTNRVAEMCKAAGIAPPTFEGSSIGVDVTFHVPVAQGRPTGQVTGQVAGQVTDQVTGQVTAEVARLLAVLAGARQPLSRTELQAALKLQSRAHFGAAYLSPTLATGLIEMTIPDKPNSRLQRYRLTAAGRDALDAKERA